MLLEGQGDIAAVGVSGPLASMREGAQPLSVLLSLSGLQV